MEFTRISFPAQGGPLDGQQIEACGMVTENGVYWPSKMTTKTGDVYALLVDENFHPIHWTHLYTIPDYKTP